jgi:hypothetical protein
MASAKGGDGGDEKAFLVLFDHDSEFSFVLHARARFITLARDRLRVFIAAWAILGRTVLWRRVAFMNLVFSADAWLTAQTADRNPGCHEPPEE